MGNINLVLNLFLTVHLINILWLKNIKSKINTLVYGEDKVESFPTPINDQITDSVTQVPEKVTKPRTPRAPRAKKEVIK